MSFEFPSGSGRHLADTFTDNQKRLREYEDQERLHAQEEILANISLKRWRFNVLTKALDSWAGHTFCQPNPPRSTVSPKAPSHSMAEWLGAAEHSTDVNDSYVGLSVTSRPPHAVVRVVDLYDKNFVKQGDPGYSNPTIMPGDSILEVDGMPAEHVPVEKLHQLLSGKMHTCVKIVLARELTFDQYEVHVIRHRKQGLDGLLTPAGPQNDILSYSNTHSIQCGGAPRVQRSAAPPNNISSQTRGTLSSFRSDRWSPVYENMQTPQLAEGAILQGHQDMVNACEWSEADGGNRYLLSASTDRTLRFWDVTHNVCHHVLQVCALVLEGHKASVYACKFSVGASDGSMILSGSADKTLRVWDGQSGACHQILEGHSQAVTCCDWSTADGGARWVLSGSDDATLRVWDLEAGTCEMLLQAHTEQVLCCQWSKGQGGRRWILSGSWDKDLKMWDAESGLVLKTLSGHAAPVYGCSFSSADGGWRWTVSASYDETVRLWDVAGAVCLRSLLGHSRWVRCCKFSDGDGGRKWVASGSRDQHVRIWQLSEGDFAGAHNAGLEELAVPSLDADAIEIFQTTEVEASWHLTQANSRGSLAEHGAEAFPSVQRAARARAVRAAAPPPTNNVEDEKLKSLVQVLQSDLDEAYRKGMNAKRELDAERSKVSNLEQAYEKLQASFECSIRESRKAGEHEAQGKLRAEWNRMQDERALLKKDREHAERILFEANEAAREVRERMKESMNASMATSNRAVMDVSEHDALLAEWRQQLQDARESLRLTEGQLEEEARQHAEARQLVEHLRQELGDHVQEKQRDALMVSDTIKRHKGKEAEKSTSEVEGVFEVKGRHSHLLNKAYRHLQMTSRKSLSAAFRSWHQNSYEACVGRAQGARMIKRRIMFRQAASFDRWVQAVEAQALLKQTVQEMSDAHGNLDVTKLVKALASAMQTIESLESSDLRKQRMENARLEKLLASEKYVSKEAKARAAAAEERLKQIESSRP